MTVPLRINTPRFLMRVPQGRPLLSITQTDWAQRLYLRPLVIRLLRTSHPLSQLRTLGSRATPSCVGTENTLCGNSITNSFYFKIYSIPCQDPITFLWCGEIDLRDHSQQGTETGYRLPLLPSGLARCRSQLQDARRSLKPNTAVACRRSAPTAFRGINRGEPRFKRLLHCLPERFDPGTSAPTAADTP